jgi:16S rRNA (adenine1518-N6/adenine1519-N6)-dimethyltransferase
MQFPFAKKSLGQNFLASPKALADIISASGAKAGDEILEIGPGRGALTAELLKTGAHITAVEKDDTLATLLNELFLEQVSSGQLRIINGDILEFDVASYVSSISSSSRTPYKLIANIPYYITGQIFRMFLEGVDGAHLHEHTQANLQPASLTLLVQKEVAERIIARDKKESILSLSVKAYGTPHYVSTVKRGSFNPAPNVDSAILHIANVSKNFFISHNISEKRFFEVVKAAFAHKRKVISSNLKEKGFVLPESINQKARAEDLALDDFALIAKSNF